MASAGSPPAGRGTDPVPVSVGRAADVVLELDDRDLIVNDVLVSHERVFIDFPGPCTECLPALSVRADTVDVVLIFGNEEVRSAEPSFVAAKEVDMASDLIKAMFGKTGKPHAALTV